MKRVRARGSIAANGTGPVKRRSRLFLFVTAARAAGAKCERNIGGFRGEPNRMDPLRHATIRNALLGFVIGAAAFVTSLPARADNVLGLYVGAGVGQSHVRDDLRSCEIITKTVVEWIVMV